MESRFFEYPFPRGLGFLECQMVHFIFWKTVSHCWILSPSSHEEHAVRIWFSAPLKYGSFLLSNVSFSPLSFHTRYRLTWKPIVCPLIVPFVPLRIPFDTLCFSLLWEHSGNGWTQLLYYIAEQWLSYYWRNKRCHDKRSSLLSVITSSKFRAHIPIAYYNTRYVGKGPDFKYNILGQKKSVLLFHDQWNPLITMKEPLIPPWSPFTQAIIKLPRKL